MPAAFHVQEKHFYCEHRLGLSRHDYNLRKVLLHQELKSESGKVLFSRKPFSFGITSPLPRRACLGLRNENRKVSLREIGLFIIPTWNYRFPIQLNLFGNTKWWTIFLRKLKKKILFCGLGRGQIISLICTRSWFYEMFYLYSWTEQKTFEVLLASIGLWVLLYKYIFCFYHRLVI